MGAQQQQPPPPEQATLRRTGALICSGSRLVGLVTVVVLLVSGAGLAFRSRRRRGGGPQRFDQENGNVVEVASFGDEKDASNVTLAVNTRKEGKTGSCVPRVRPGGCGLFAVFWWNVLWDFWRDTDGWMDGWMDG